MNTPTVPGEESILLRGLDAECLRQVISGFYRTAADAPLVGRMFVNEFTLDSERLDYLYEHYIAPTLQLMVPSIDRLVAAAESLAAIVVNGLLATGATSRR